MTIEYHLLGCHTRTDLLHVHSIWKPSSIKTTITGNNKDKEKGKVRYKTGKKWTLMQEEYVRGQRRKGNTIMVQPKNSNGWWTTGKLSHLSDTSRWVQCVC